MKKNNRRLHPLELAAHNASFDILGYIRKKIKAALNKRNYDYRKDKEWRPLHQ